MASPSTGDRSLVERLAPLARARARGIAAFASGLVFSTSTPPIDFLPGALLGLALFAWSLDLTPVVEPRGYRAAARRGALFGFAANALALRFVPDVIVRFTPLPGAAAWLALVLLAAAQSIPWILGAVVARLVAVRVTQAPAFLAFAVGVYGATFIPCVFPWTPAGALSPWPALVGVADVVGERGASFLLAAACGLAAMRTWRASAMAAAGLAALVAYGGVRIRSVEAARDAAPHASIALVQPDFEATDRWEEKRAPAMLARLTDLTKRAEARGAELVVWPESAYPYTLAHATRRSPIGARAILQDGVRGPVMTGAYMASKEAGYNAAIVVDRHGLIAEPYDKRHLLWFGETVPLGDTFPWLKKTFQRGTGLAAGKTEVPLVADGVRAAVLNCYEDTLPEAGRETAEARPNVLVNVTNDAWFAGTKESELHLRLATMRAIEARRDLLRAVNRGPTSFVDAAGVLRAKYAADEPGILMASAALLDGPPTAYATFGDAPLLLLVTFSLFLMRRRAAREELERDAQSTTGAASDEEGRPRSDR